MLNRLLLVRRVYARPRFPLQLFSSGAVWTCEKVRTTFLQYFIEKHDHLHYPSSPVVPLNDPTLLFANAGMNQFKPIILGTVERTSALASVRRAVNSQKCIRAGGKHNDLDDVGKDTYHHTFFEMLGTWSFNDYFKRECIAWAFELLVHVYRLPKDRLYVTYFAGDADQGLEADTEARDLWLQYLPAERVLPFGKAANFWEMGDSGPCGPCSEIHFDRIGGRDASALVNRDDPNVVEIWNLVFMQYNRDAVSGRLSRLPAQHIDTGMGLERLVSILQNVTSNYDTDVFASILAAISRVTGHRPYEGRVGKADSGHADMAYRVLADHCRTLIIAIADGAVPSSEGRGYVLRRILRRAIRYGSQTLSAPPQFFERLIGEVIDILSPTFPEVAERRNTILEIVSEEERAFSALLNRGIAYFERLHLSIPAGNDTISGSDAFHLYDTLGFPLDLTQIMAAEAGLRVDVDGFRSAMEEQKERSRRDLAEKKLQGRLAVTLAPQDIATLASQNYAPTIDSYKYTDLSLEGASIIGIILPDGLCRMEEVSLEKDSVVGVVLDKSCFYSEGGGQLSDTGMIRVMNNDRAVLLEVIHVASYGDYILHTCVPQENVVLKRGDKCNEQVDTSRRYNATINHTMTHILNSALRHVLGSGVDQRGSFVGDDKLRFDFSYGKSLTSEELERLEMYVNDVISNQSSVHAQLIPLADAMAIKGVRAVFGDEYPDPVRVVTVAAADGGVVSVELCGGTHLNSAGEAQSFVIIEESSVSKGVRRLTAVSSNAAKEAQQKMAELEKQRVLLLNRYDNIIHGDSLGGIAEIAELQSAMNDLKKEIISSVVSASFQKRVVQELEESGKKLSAARKKLVMQEAKAEIEVRIAEVDSMISRGKSTFALQVNLGDDMKSIKLLCDSLTAKYPHASYIIFSTDVEKNKVSCSAYVSREAAPSGLQAMTWLQAVVSSVGGKSGGKEVTALGTFEDVALIDDAISACNTYIESI